MGGPGSGRRAELSTETLEDSPRLRLAALRGAGLLLPGAKGLLFASHPQPYGRHLLWIERAYGHLVVSFLGVANLPPQKIAIQEQPCNFGGRRFYMVCSGAAGRNCGHRSMDLYLTGAYFVCRRCSGSIYRSQTISAPHLKALARITAIHAKMGLPPGSVLTGLLPERPKGMRFVTYYKTAQALLAAGRDFQHHLLVDQAKMLEAVDRIGRPRPRKSRGGKPGTYRTSD